MSRFLTLMSTQQMKSLIVVYIIICSLRNLRSAKVLVNPKAVYQFENIDCMCAYWTDLSRIVSVS